MDHVGEIVEIVVIRSDSVSPRHLKLLVAEVAPDEINRLVFCHIVFIYVKFASFS